MPIIPNEIYFCILDYIAPPTGRLWPEQLGIFTNLSRVCRFFANFCLPRIFEFVVFSGSMFSDDTLTGLRNDKTSRESTLCTQIAAKQPLALALAKTVRVFQFTDWKLDGAGSWAALFRPFADKYIAAMLHMKNIRELKFRNSIVDVEHWNSIRTLESLEELSFDLCTFRRGPADVEAEKRAKFKVSCLWVVNCHSLLLHQVVVAIDARYLRTLTVYNKSIGYSYIDWLSQSALTEVHFIIWQYFYAIPDNLQSLQVIVMQTRKSLEALTLFVDDPLQLERILRRLFNDPVWKNLPLLRSLKLLVQFPFEDAATAVRQLFTSSVSQFLTRALGPFLSLGLYWSFHKYTIPHAGRQPVQIGYPTRRGSSTYPS